MKTYVWICRGPLKGWRGWIRGSLEDRARRGITKAIVHAGPHVELLSIENLREDDQPCLFARDPTSEAI